MKIEVEIDKDTIVGFLNEKHMNADLMEEAWQICEDNKNTEDVYYPIMDKLMDLNRTYSETWNEWIVPELDDRRKQNKHVSYELVLYLLNNWSPGPHKWDIQDVIEDKYMEGMGHSSLNNIPKEELQYIEEEYGLPKEWKKSNEIDHFIDELNLFEDFDFLETFLDNNWYELRDRKIKEELISLVLNGKANKNLEFFLKLVDNAKPAKDMFRPYHKEYITDILEEFNGDEEEWEIIREKFYDVDFEVPYKEIIRDSVQSECRYIDEQTKKNPMYRHD